MLAAPGAPWPVSVFSYVLLLERFVKKTFVQNALFENSVKSQVDTDLFLSNTVIRIHG